MSDSDSELLTNVFGSQNEITTVSARGPNINIRNLTGVSFQNNVLTSTMQVPRNYEWQRGAQSNCDQRSISYRRETSPMSIASACGARQRHFDSSYYARGMSSQRSVYNGRGGSPMSMRSVDSNVSAADIAMALKNNQFNKYDMKIIIEAYNKCMKQKVRKRIEKRRNLRLLKGYRRKSRDSGELGSNSSNSSDDDRRTANYKNNWSSSRSTRMDIADFRKTIKESNIIKDCTDSFKQNRAYSMVGRPTKLNSSRASVSSFRSMTEYRREVTTAPPNYNNIQRLPSMTQRDRFRNGFLLPSQRFSRVSSIPEAVENTNSGINKQNEKSNSKSHDVAANTTHEIFSEITAIKKPTNTQRKRSVDSDDELCLPNNKRSRVASPCQNMANALKQSAVDKSLPQNFEFAKPAFPVKKSANSKCRDKLISKSANINSAELLITKSFAPLSNSIVQLHPPAKQINPVSQLKIDNENGDIDKQDSAEKSAVSQNTTDLSSRPSFIKRKLFTQKMDLTENKNTDIVDANSPQNSMYGSIQKEKNKARKLVTSRYCLSRDIQKDENNLLDLIHKLVPAERINVTNQTNKTVTQNDKSDEIDDKWDITSIISTRNNDEDVSDTFTDEETIIAEGKQLRSPKVSAKNSKKSPPKSQVTQKVLIEKNGPEAPNKRVQKCVKLFWDTDYESDADASLSSKKVAKHLHQNKEYKENQVTENDKQPVAPKSKFQGLSSMFQSSKQTLGNNVSLLNNTTENISKFNNASRNFKLCSHRSTKPILKVVLEKATEDAKLCFELQKAKTPINCHLELSVKENNEQPSNNKGKKDEKHKLEIKKTPPKNRKTNKEKHLETSKVATEIEKSQKIYKIHKMDEHVKKLTKNRTNTAKSMPQYTEPNNFENKLQDKYKSKTTNRQPDRNENEQKSKKEVKNASIVLDNHKSDTASKQNKKANTCNIKIQNKKSDLKKNKGKAEIAEFVRLSPDHANNRKKSQNSRASKSLNLHSSEENLTETNNNVDIKQLSKANETQSRSLSVRPVRSCRNPKQNLTLDTSKANETRSRSLSVRPVRSCRNSKQNLTLDTSKANETRSRSLSVRPVRSCRNSKQNLTLDTSKANETQSRSLRSRDVSLTSLNNQPLNTKPVQNKKMKITKNEQSVLSDLSFSLTQDKSNNKKQLSSKNSRLFRTKELDTSDVSFSLTHDKLNDFNLSKNEIRPFRNKLPNRRYVS